MTLVILFYFTSSMLNMFQTLIHPTSGTCDFSIESPHWSCVLVSMCAVVSVFISYLGKWRQYFHLKRKNSTLFHGI